VNAIEHVIIPKIENTIKFINSELDEQDREEFFRLKKVQGKKKQAAELLLKNQANKITEAGAIVPAKNLLEDYEKDPDVMF
jgi:V-type H+-transporting ATPase subunit D